MNNTILFHEHGIYLNGKYQILLASSLFYFRIPPEKWESRMRLLKAAGYNAIDVYFPWNYHETEPDNWCFEKDRNITRFLTLAAEQELYVIARPGPYICSEWDGGAIPAWLAAQHIHIRQDDPAFLEYIYQWYEQILPRLVPFQIGHGGSIICMQIENELDFFRCKSPVSYMEKLMHKAKNLGIDVPLFYCCGQNDLLRGGGLTPGLYSAFNVYDSADSKGLEERSLFLYHSVAERKMPFLVTETNREHSFLKRLLVCGAKLLSPYNQTAGRTPGWYNGLTNWGSNDFPLSLMASDYDFQSMIGSSGEVNEEFYQARLLAALLFCLGEDIAKGYPKIAETTFTISSSNVNSILPVLHTGRGDFLEISNLGEACTMELLIHDFCFHLSMPSFYTMLLPSRLLLSASQNIILYGCNYELAWFAEKDSKITVFLYGTGPLEVLLSIQGKMLTIEKDCVNIPESYAINNVTFVFAEKNIIASMSIPGLPDFDGNFTKQQEETEISELFLHSEMALPVMNRRNTTVLPMENLGQYRGIGSYQFYLEEPSDLLLTNTADILTFKQNNTLLKTWYGRGNCVTISAGKGDYEILSEIWGHSNFDDIRCRSLQMGSLKGVEQIVYIKERLALSDNWLFDLDEQPIGEWYFFRHSPFNTIMSIDAYNRAVSPLHTVYAKWVELPPACDSLYLHFSIADCIIYVYVNGHCEGSILKDDPYLDLSRYAGDTRIELCLRIQRRYFSDCAGEVTLLAGNRISECIYSTVAVEDIAPSCESDSVKTVSLPLSLSADTDTLLSLSPPDSSGRDGKLYFEGQDVKLTILSNHTVMGRLVLENDTFPVVRGGQYNVLYLSSEELSKESALIWCQPIGPHPRLDRIKLCLYTPVVS